MLGISMVTLGVGDVAKATAFYEQLGLKRSEASQDSVTFFQAGACVLGLYGLDALAEDGHAGALWSGKGGFSLALNVADEAKVDEIVAHAEKIGARILKAPQKTFWGGYHGYFADPDGHIWEIAHNPFFPVDERGELTLP
jgi:catechol 2,3-dioxygenase-like lactoylglutathione lyase family enzyme